MPVKFESRWPKGIGGDSIKSKSFASFSILSSYGLFVHRSETILAILVESHLSNISMTFE